MEDQIMFGLFKRKAKPKPQPQLASYKPSIPAGSVGTPTPIHTYKKTDPEAVDALFSSVGFDFDGIHTSQQETTIKINRSGLFGHRINTTRGTPKPKFRVKESSLWDHPAITAHQINTSQRVSVLNRIRFWRTHSIFLYTNLAIHGKSYNVNLDAKRELMFALACGVEYCKDAISELDRNESNGMRIPQEYRTGVLEFDTYEHARISLESAIQLFRHYMKEQYEDRYVTDTSFEILGMTNIGVSDRWLDFFNKHQCCKSSDGRLKKHWHERAKRLLPKVMCKSFKEKRCCHLFTQAQTRAMEWVEMVLQDKYIEMTRQCELLNVYGEYYLRDLLSELESEIEKKMFSQRGDWIRSKVVNKVDSRVEKPIKLGGIDLTIRRHPFRYKYTDLDLNIGSQKKAARHCNVSARYITSWAGEKYPFTTYNTDSGDQVSNPEKMIEYVGESFKQQFQTPKPFSLKGFGDVYSTFDLNDAWRKDAIEKAS